MFLFSFLSHFKCYPWTGGSLSGELLQCEQHRGGKRRQVQVEERQKQQAALRPQHRRKHTLCSTRRVSPARRPQCCRCTRLHGTDWHTRRGFTFSGLFGMHGVVKYRLGSMHRAPKEGDVKRMKGRDPANYWKQAKRKHFNRLRGMLQHFGG